MIKNLLTVALRNFKRDGWYSLLNILGLTIGITFSLFLIFYVKDELSYDKYNEKADRIFRISSNIKESDKDTMRWVSTQFPLAPTLRKDYPEVEEAVRFVGEDKKMYGGEICEFMRRRSSTPTATSSRSLPIPSCRATPTPP